MWFLEKITIKRDFSLNFFKNENQYSKDLNFIIKIILKENFLLSQIWCLEYFYVIFELNLKTGNLNEMEII